MNNLTFDIPTMSVLLGATFTIASLLWGIRRDLRELKRNGYTMAAACEHALRLKIANPILRVPDPRHPERLIGCDDE